MQSSPQNENSEMYDSTSNISLGFVKRELHLDTFVKIDFEFSNMPLKNIHIIWPNLVILILTWPYIYYDLV